MTEINQVSSCENGPAGLASAQQAWQSEGGDDLQHINGANQHRAEIGLPALPGA